MSTETAVDEIYNFNIKYMQYPSLERKLKFRHLNLSKYRISLILRPYMGQCKWKKIGYGWSSAGMVRTSNQIPTRGRVSADSASQRGGLRRTRLVLLAGVWLAVAGNMFVIVGISGRTDVWAGFDLIVEGESAAITDGQRAAASRPRHHRTIEPGEADGDGTGRCCRLET